MEKYISIFFVQFIVMFLIFQGCSRQQWWIFDETVFSFQYSTSSRSSDIDYFRIRWDFFLFRSLLFPPTTPLNIVVVVDVAAAFSSLFILFFSSPLERTQRRICVRQQTPIAISFFSSTLLSSCPLHYQQQRKERERETEKKKTHIDKETKNISSF